MYSTLTIDPIFLIPFNEFNMLNKAIWYLHHHHHFDKLYLSHLNQIYIKLHKMAFVPDLKKTPTTTKSLFKIKNNTHHHHHHRSGGYRIQCVRVMIQQCLIDPMVVSRSGGGQQIRC
ncbi:hypothetical protein HanXRQr2_Chr04g0178311 [Helianthus annuus]|uniref:Uncharacterized protein n=1 Tax=Helianthus annuus TaxID=4232 RepID=A0A251V0B8_HELAN|nr:hypothetical protein HanXRQr2_Chr04g0178311 [Helianthus annuus]